MFCSLLSACLVELILIVLAELALLAEDLLAPAMAACKDACEALVESGKECRSLSMELGLESRFLTVWSVGERLRKNTAAVARLGPTDAVRDELDLLLL